jgi:tRNA threonylcarbamoyladenosine biosynthesis protein TsaB
MPQNQCILAIDTATGPCSVALWADGRLAGSLEDNTPSSQSARLLPMIEKLLGQCCISYADLTSVACTTGPGSFTGIRVGLAAARGIAFAAKIPSMGFTTLEVMAFAAQGKNSLLTALTAGKGEWYYQGFSSALAPLFAPRVGPPEVAVASVPKDSLFAGNIAQVPAEFTATGVTIPTASALAALAAGAGENTPPLLPFYIRPPDAIIPSKII